MSPDRHTQIIRLLQTRDHNLPDQQRHDQAASGFVHGVTHRETCPDCLANGRPDGMPGCDTCGGNGYLERLEPRDPYATDRVLPYGLSHDRHETIRRRDAELARLAAQTRPPWSSTADELADANEHPYGWERARGAMWRDYDYPALDQALEQLRQQCDTAYHVLHAVYVYGYLPLTAPTLAVVADLAVEFLSERLPDPLRAPGQPDPVRVAPGPMRREAGGRARTSRDQAMREAAAAGATVTELCERFGVSKSTVYSVVNGAAV